MEQLPLFLDLNSKSCLIVGAGSVAERKSRLLLRAGARVTVVAPVMSEYFESLETESVTLVHAPFEADMCRGHHLIVAATGIDSVNRQVVRTAQEYGIWCNVVDQAELSTAFFPAIIDRSPVTIAVGTGGTSPTLARRIKQQIEALLPARLGAMAERLGGWRTQVKRRLKDAEERRFFWEGVVSGPIADHLLAGRESEAEQEFHCFLDAPKAKQSQGEAYLVGAGPGDVGLMTLRGHQLLSQADVVLYDSLISEEILDLARRDAKRLCVGKGPGESHKQGELTRTLVRLVQKGYRVCRLKGGDPLIFGRGGEEAEALEVAGLPFEIVPGVSAAQGCAASVGIPLTFRGIASSVTLATGIAEKDSEPDWASLARPGQTLALYMGVRSLKRITTKLIANGLADSTPAALVENGTTRHQRFLESTLARIADLGAEQGIKSPAILFVGESLSRRSEPSLQTSWNNHTDMLFQKVMSA